MARTLASLTFLACVLLAKGNGMCQGAAECDSVDDTSSALLQLQQAVPQGRLQQQEGLQQRADGPMPKLKCTYYDGACWARKTACDLTEEMKQWDGSGAKHSNISWLTDKLRDLCFNKVSRKTAGGTAAGVAEPFHLNCFNGRYNACPSTNEGVVEYLEKHPGAKYATDAGKAASMTALSWTRLLLKTKKMGLGGDLTFAFLGSMLSTFFPPSGGLPTNPCTYAAAKNWGKCVWEQVKPFVENYVRGEISTLFKNIWKDKLRGYHDALQTAQNEARADSHIENGTNGTVVNITDQARKDMDDGLEYLDHLMGVDAPFFQDKEGDYVAEGVYLSMFSSLHVSVMTSRLGSEKFHTHGQRFHTQRYTLCYARKVLKRALRAHNLRMSLIFKKTEPRYCVHCEDTSWNNWHCCGERVTYWDKSSNCSWNEVCQLAECSSVFYHCHHNTPCDRGKQENAYGCHRAWVQKQSEAMWLHWLAPIPTWIEMVMKMQELKLKNVDNWRARRHKRRVRRWGRGRFVEERDGDGSFADCGTV